MKKGMVKIEYLNFYLSVTPQHQDGLLSLQRRKERSPEQTICESLKTASSSQEKDEIAKLQARVKELEAQLLHAEIKAEAYDEMINVAEAKFRIPIRKKAGAKQ